MIKLNMKNIIYLFQLEWLTYETLWLQSFKEFTTTKNNFTRHMCRQHKSVNHKFDLNNNGNKSAVLSIWPLLFLTKLIAFAI